MVEIIYKMSKPYQKDDQLGKVGKRAKIKNRYNQVPHLTLDTTWQSDKHTIRRHKRGPRGQSFPGRWPQGINKQTRVKAKQTQDRNNTNDSQKKYRLGKTSKTILLEGLNQFHGAILH